MVEVRDLRQHQGEVALRGFRGHFRRALAHVSSYCGLAHLAHFLHSLICSGDDCRVGGYGFQFVASTDGLHDLAAVLLADDGIGVVQSLDLGELRIREVEIASQPFHRVAFRERGTNSGITAEMKRQRARGCGNGSDKKERSD